MNQLRPYQVDGVDFLEKNGRALLADEPGLGKSVQALRAAKGRTLVVAPRMIFDAGTWITEVDKWGNPEAEFTFAPYSQLALKDGRKTLPAAAEEWLQDWDTLILDEAHYLKGRKTKWSIAAQQIAKQSKRVYLLTGTPIPNWSNELFVLLRLLRPEEAKKGEAFGSYARWISRWFSLKPNRFAPMTPDIDGLKACVPECAKRDSNDPCAHYLEFARMNLGDLMLRRTRDQVLSDMPPLTVIPVELTMTPTQTKEYKRLRKDFQIHFGHNDAPMLGSDDVRMAWSLPAQNAMTDQCATAIAAAVPFGDDLRLSASEIMTGSAKLSRLYEDLEGRSRPTLVFAHYKSTIRAAEEIAKSLRLRVAVVHGDLAKHKRYPLFNDFQDGKYDVLIGSLDTISEGLTLTAADVCIFLEWSWRPSRNEQAMRRIDRLGQTRPTTALIYVTRDSIDVHKHKMTAEKTDQQMKTLTAAEYAKLL